MATRIFTPDCQYLTEDTMFVVKHSPIADFRLVDDQAIAQRNGLSAPFWAVDWNFVVARSEDVAKNRQAKAAP